MNKNLFISVFLLVFISGCSTVKEVTTKVKKEADEVVDNGQRQVATTTDDNSPVPDDPFYAPIEPSLPTDPAIATGSLFNSEETKDLYSYSSTFEIGDNLTIILDEQANASKSANSALDKTLAYDLQPIVVPGKGGPKNMTHNGREIQLNMNQTQSFAGTGTADQSHNLNGTITVTVIRKLANGNLVVRGEKWLVINNGKEYLRVTGIVRPKDVTEDNSVSSAKIADARIEFSGKGDQADTQTQGWLSRIFNSSIWPL